jgi:ribosome-binding factor A
MKHQLRRIPEIRYYLDDTLDHVFKMEELFKKIEDEKKGEE